MSAALDLRLIERARATAEASDLSPARVHGGRGARVPDILSSVYDPAARAFLVRYQDLSHAQVGQDELEGLSDRTVVACFVDEFRRGVDVVLDDGTVTSFSAEYPRYLRDEAYRRSVDRTRRSGSRDLGARVARRVVSVRRAKGWSVAELARRSGIAAPNVHRVESGRHVPSTATLVRLSEALDVSLSTLVQT